MSLWPEMKGCLQEMLCLDRPRKTTFEQCLAYSWYISQFAISLAVEKTVL